MRRRREFKNDEKLDPEMLKFQNDSLQSVREFKTGKYARVTQVQPSLLVQADYITKIVITPVITAPESE